MKIAIISAMRKELDLVLAQMEKHGGYEEKEFGLFIGYTGEIGGHEVVVLQCGIGKVNSALRTLRLIDAYSPDLVINSGVAGGVDESLHIGDVLVAESVAYHDVWCGPGTEPGAADGFPVRMESDAKAVACLRDISGAEKEAYKFGLIASGDIFVSKPEEVVEIKGKLPEACGCDMESGSIAQTCMMCGVPFVVVRVLSDMPGGGENISEYQNFWSEAPERTFEAVMKLIKSL